MYKKILIALFVVSTLNAQDLKTTINEVISSNPIIQERLKNYNITKEDITTAKSGYYPKLDLSLGAGYEQSKTTTVQNGLPDNISDSALDVYQSSITYTQNLFNGFKTTQAVKEQEHRTAAASYSYIENVNDISFEIVNIYIQIMKNKELLKTAQENVDINTDIFKKVQKLYDSGLTTLSEVNKIESSLSLAKSNHVVQENTLMDYSYNMQRILGRHLDIDEMSKPMLNIKLPTTIEEATQFSMQNNPSILVSDYNIKLAQATYEGSKAAFYPRIDIEISESLNKNHSASEGTREQFRAMAYVKYNLFNGFSDTANLQKSISTIHQEVELKNKLRRKVIEGLSLSWVAYEKLSTQLTHLQNYKKFSLKTLTLYSKEYDLGRRSLLDLLSAQNDFIASKSQIINTESSILFAKFRILDAMGILVSTIINDTSTIYSNVGLAGKIPVNEDSLPISYDRDNDLIVNEKDICDNSLATAMRNIYGCKESQDGVKRIERYDSFLFDSLDTELNSDGEERLSDLIAQVKPYGWSFLKFELLGNVEDDDIDEKRLVAISKQRAEYIKTQLIKVGAKPENIAIHVQSDKSPAFSNESSSSIELNNRVDIIVKKLYK